MALAMALSEAVIAGMTEGELTVTRLRTLVVEIQRLTNRSDRITLTHLIAAGLHEVQTLWPTENSTDWWLTAQDICEDLRQQLASLNGSTNELESLIGWMWVYHGLLSRSQGDPLDPMNAPKFPLSATEQLEAVRRLKRLAQIEPVRFGTFANAVAIQSQIISIRDRVLQDLPVETAALDEVAQQADQLAREYPLHIQLQIFRLQAHQYRYAVSSEEDSDDPDRAVTLALHLQQAVEIGRFLVKSGIGGEPLEVVLTSSLNAFAGLLGQHGNKGEASRLLAEVLELPARPSLRLARGAAGFSGVMVEMTRRYTNAERTVRFAEVALASIDVLEASSAIESFDRHESLFILHLARSVSAAERPDLYQRGWLGGAVDAAPREVSDQEMPTLKDLLEEVCARVDEGSVQYCQVVREVAEEGDDDLDSDWQERLSASVAGMARLITDLEAIIDLRLNARLEVLDAFVGILDEYLRRGPSERSHQRCLEVEAAAQAIVGLEDVSAAAGHLRQGTFPALG